MNRTHPKNVGMTAWHLKVNSYQVIPMQKIMAFALILDVVLLTVGATTVALGLSLVIVVAWRQRK
jgi:hypothetical protein